MLNLDDLIPASIAPNLIKGKWCTIGFTPVLGSNERLNIGVAFQPQRGKPKARLISSATGFRSLYGSNGVENFAFLLAITAENIQRLGTLTPASPHVSFGPMLPAQGESIDAILDSLFNRMVPLRIPEEQAAAPARTLNTQNLRRHVFRELRRKHSSTADRFLHEQPVVINFENRPHLLDLPVWQPGDLVTNRLFGSIVSSQYIDEVYRQHDLDRAFRNIDTAKRFIASSGRGALFILRPDSDDKQFPQRDIDNDIDSVAWPLAKAGIQVEVDCTEERLQKRVANFICG